jgi:ATP-binding cassette subfamily B multidrug efflux pump
MLRLRKYLKPYALFIILSIALLFGQANADLALPDYLSKIVNNGIQQNGIEDAVPMAIRESEMNRLLIFMSDAEADRVVDNYELVEPSSANTDVYREDYPLLATEPIYVRKDLDRDELNTLNTIMGKAWLVVSRIEQMIADPSQAPPMDLGFDFDPTMIPEGTDLFEILKRLPDAQLSALRDRLDEMSDSLGESMITQMAVGAVRLEYEAIGMDVGQLQADYILHTGGLMLLISLFGGICAIVVGFLASRTAAGAARDIRKDVFQKVEHLNSPQLH